MTSRRFPPSALNTPTSTPLRPVLQFAHSPADLYTLSVVAEVDIAHLIQYNARRQGIMQDFMSFIVRKRRYAPSLQAFLYVQ